jgi:bacillithiol system protein YtxJ
MIEPERERGGMQEITSTQQADEVMQGEPAVLFKHNTTCPISARAHHEMERLQEQNPDARIYFVDIHGQRAVSDHVEQATGIRHESPQALVVGGGKVAFDSSGFAISAEEVATHLRGAAGSERSGQ